MPETTPFAGMTNSGGTTDGSLQANTVLRARYKILGVLGGGGMGTVYQSRDLNFPDVRRLVAIKEMQNLATDPSLREQTLKTFRREANILAALTHPAVPKIYDFFDHNDRAYLVMEYINGSDLEQLLSKTKDLPIEKIIEWAIDLCDVLDYLHNHQPDPIIFRDVKPSNVMIDSFGKVRLIDFGIAKAFVSGVKHTMIGTEGYSAPEQYRGDATKLSDVYSLGATLHHVLTRKDPRLEAPFSFNERPIRDLNPNAPPGLVSIVEKALAFEHSNRYQSCAEMKAALQQLLYRPLNAAAAAATQPAPGAASQGTGFFDDMSSDGSISPKWKFTTEDEIRSSPIAVNDIAYITSYDSNVWAVNLETGEQIWKFATTRGISASPVFDRGSKLIMVGSEDNIFYALDHRTGKQAWIHVTKEKIRGTARAAHDHVFFGSDDHRLYALGAMNGRFLWDLELDAEVRSRPFVTNELIITGTESGEVIAVGLSKESKWRFRAKRAVTSSPIVDSEGMCYFGSLDGNMYCVDSNTGYNSWKYKTQGQIYSSPVVENGLVIFGSTDGVVYAIDTRTQREKWKFKTQGPVVSSPTYHDGSVYIGGTDEHLYCIDAKTGKERWKYKTGGAITSTPFVAGDTLLIGSLDRTLYAFSIGS